MTDDVYDALKTAAEQKRTSLAAEVGDRLARSLNQQETLREAIGLLYGRNLGVMLKILGDAMRTAGQMAQVEWFLKHRGRYLEWTQVPELYDQIHAIGRELVDAARPPEDATEDTFMHADGIALRNFVTERMQERFDAQVDAKAGRRRNSKPLSADYLRKVFSWKRAK